MTPDRKMSLIMLFTCLLFSAGSVLAADNKVTVGGYAAAEALRLGERMYLQGILPSGEPMKAIVQGDIEVSGTMITCSNCHHRSGLGSYEGGVVTPPTNGAKLFAPLRGPQDIPGTVMKRTMAATQPRPAYTDESLTQALVNGVDPTGRKFSPTMPRYLLDDTSAKVMNFYLKNLNATFSPGVTRDEIRFATIVTTDTVKSDKDAMIATLRAFIDDEWNARLSDLVSPWNAWNLTVQKVDGKSYRNATLDIWELSGPPETWHRQLAEFNRNKPVFAVIGGLVPGPWDPIHTFCESNRIPCIMPLTELPVVSDSSWYTLYISKGFYQEGEAAASYLSRVFDLPPEKQIVQVYRNSSQAKALASAFRATWKKLGESPLHDRILATSEVPDAAFWAKLISTYPDAVLLVWLDKKDIGNLSSLPNTANRPTTVMLSSGLLNGQLSSIPDSIRDFTFITYPTRLPGDEKYARTLITNWMKMHRMALDNLSVSSKVISTTRLISTALVDMGVDFYRDYFLDLLDENSDLPNSSITYPMLSFGPGQRYAAKGCYIVTLTKGDNPKVVRQSDWVFY